MTGVLHVVREINEPDDQIKAEWLGAETRIPIPPRQPFRYRHIVWERRFSLGVLLFSFLSGFATCGSVVLFARGQTDGRR